MMKLFCEMVGLGKKILVILKPTVRSDSMNQAASYLSSVPRHPIFSGIGGHGLPSGYATDFSVGITSILH